MPSPSHRRPDPFAASDPAVLDEPVLAPGLAAALRRHPRLRNGAAIGSIALGTIVFVLACLTTPLAGAQPRQHRHTTPAAQADLGSLLALTGPDPVAAVPVTQPAPTPSPASAPAPAAARPAPAAISGLAANGIPSVALNAYRVAAARMDHADPGCGIAWWLLAGIGRVESDHGRFAGARLLANGTSVPKIIGIPLDGHGTEVVRDTDGGRLDGDPVYDRAVGPMQFVPQTWESYGVDATGDGVADPFNINDAALTAARYLCAAGGNLRTHDGQVRAVLTYNHSNAYLAEVLALADAYRRGVPVSGIPRGNVTGALAPVRRGSLPAANPGAPTALDGSGSAGHGTKSAPGGSGGSASTPAAPAEPAPGTSSSAPPAGGSTSSTPPSGGTSSTPPSGGSSSTPPPTSSPTPTPSPTKKCVLWDLLNPGHCVMYG
jgi:membrane-bound lytic murein transglycosylase B